MIAQSMDLPLYRQSISGRSLTQSMEYEKTEGDEVEDLFNLLTRVKDAHPNVRGNEKIIMNTNLHCRCISGSNSLFVSKVES